MTKIEILQKTKSNIFTINELISLWNVSDRKEVLGLVKELVDEKEMFVIRNGIYSIQSKFNPFELTQNIVPSSYISYWTALFAHQIILKRFDEIHCFAEHSKVVEIRNKKIIFHQLKKEIFQNKTGIIVSDGFSIASPERAVCDSLYMTQNIEFDRLFETIDLDELEKISKIYGNKRLEKSIDQITSYIRKFRIS
jgi:hypothetical protein